MTVAEAAEQLGVTQDVIRQRIRRDTIAHEKDESGQVYVYLDTTNTAHDNVQDANDDGVRDALLEELRDRVRYLEEESRRKDAILMTMAQCIPELEPARDASPEPRGSPQTDTDGSGKGGADTGEERTVSWWRRLFGGSRQEMRQGD